MAIPNAPLVQYLAPFQTKAYCITISASATATAAVQLPQGGQQLRIINEGPNVAFLAFGKSGNVLATLPVAGQTNTCDAVLSGEDELLTRDMDDNFISAVCRASGTAVLTIYVGVGT